MSQRNLDLWDTLWIFTSLTIFQRQVKSPAVLVVLGQMICLKMRKGNMKLLSGGQNDSYVHAHVMNLKQSSFYSFSKTTPNKNSRYVQLTIKCDTSGWPQENSKTFVRWPNAHVVMEWTSSSLKCYFCQNFIMLGASTTQ